MAENDAVARPSTTQAAIASRAEVVRTLVAGTVAMRAAGKKYLPQEPAESKAAYDNRVARTSLFNATGKTVQDMTGKVFQKPVVLKETVPPVLAAYAENIDLTGRHVNQFARDVFYDAMQPGVAYILVDMPPAVQRADGQPATLADQQAAGIRPYCVHVPAERLIGWRSTTENGAEVLTQVRILECVTEQDGEWHEKAVDQIRVLEPGTWATWRKNEKEDEWVPYESGTTSLQKITLVPVYTNRTGFMVGSPPLEKLAELNVAHWQSQSDQRNILHVARVPILFASGIGEDTQLNVGASEMIRAVAYRQCRRADGDRRNPRRHERKQPACHDGA